jgi:glycosyltransferase involved in cell wall biosynthesis
VRNHPFVHVARMGGYYDMKYYRHCDHLVGNTQDIRDYFIRQGWPAERAHYLPNFIDAHPAPAVDRASLQTPEDAPLIVALGRLHPNKAFDVLLHAVAETPGVWLWIAGSGPEDFNLKGLAAQLGIANRVRFLGWRNDVAALLAASTVLAVPSRHEPLGNVVLEGWAHGVPVIAAEAVGPAALIADGDDGLLVPVDDADALADAFRRVLDSSDLRARVVAGGKARYETEFTEQAVCGRYIAFFEQVAAP